MLERFFGEPDQSAPFVVYVGGRLEQDDRRRLIHRLRAERALAATRGHQRALDQALELIEDALARRTGDEAVIVARGGDRPVVLEMPGFEPDTPTRLFVRDELPSWLHHDDSIRRSA